MKKGKKILMRFFLVFLALCFLGITDVAVGFENLLNKNPVADVNFVWRGIYFRPKLIYSAITLTVSGPDGSIFQESFEAGSSPFFELFSSSVDGFYTYELRVIPLGEKNIRDESEEAGESRSDSLRRGLKKALVQSGYFLVRGGRIVAPGTAVESSQVMPLDVLHYDDVIITGSICVGFDCQNGESFGFDTIRLKENNLQINFMDTSVSPFPTNDWIIQVNDTTSGGASYFTIWDVDGGKRPFTIEAGAPANSLYIEDYGRVGLGTSVPYVELHIADGDTPTVRLDQDGSSGWTPQSWDVAGNETNFFIRDVTNGSKLSFRIQPGAPSSSLCIKSDGKVGIGTWSPQDALEIETTGSNAAIYLDRTDGTHGFFAAKKNNVQIGSYSSNNFKMIIAGDWKMALTTIGSLEMRNGATCTAGGVWTDASSIKLKENIEDLTTDEAIDALKELSPVKFNSKLNREERHVGFIAEEVPDLVATVDRKGLSPMDIVAVLTKVVQQQQEIISKLQKRIDEFEKELKPEK